MTEKKKFKQALFCLGVGVFFSFLSRGDMPVELAVWLSPVFLLRFFRLLKPLKGYLLALPFVAAAILFSTWGMAPIPTAQFIVLSIVSAVIGQLSYLFDRLLFAKLPAGLRTLSLPVFMVSIQFLMSSAGDSGTWGNHAYSIRDAFLQQSVSVVGIWGLLFLIYWAAAVINEIWAVELRLKEIKALLIVFLAVLTAVYGYGTLRLRSDKPAGHAMRAAGITPTPEQRKILVKAFYGITAENADTGGETGKQEMRAQLEQIFFDLLDRSVKAAQAGAQLVSWSEAASAIFAGDEERFVRQARSAAREHRFYLGLAAGVIMEEAPQLAKNSLPYFKNKLIFILPDGNIAFEHHKAKLAAGSETAMTIPGDGKIKTAAIAAGSVSGFICYELDFPPVVRQAGKTGAVLLLAPSNDRPQIKYTHEAMARFRAIENGLALFRSASQGISTAVDPYGRMLSQLDYYQGEGFPFNAVLPIKRVPTLYSLIGDLFAYLVLLVLPVLIIIALLRRKKAGGSVS